MDINATYEKINLKQYGQKFYRPVAILGVKRRRLRKLFRRAAEAQQFAERFLARYRSFCDTARFAEWAKERKL